MVINSRYLALCMGYTRKHQYNKNYQKKVITLHLINPGLNVYKAFRDIYLFEGSGCFFHDKMIAPVPLISNWLLPPR
jgi:hypothetical protein